MINPIFYQYQADKSTDIINDYLLIRSKVESKPETDVVFEGVPIFGRINSVPEKLNNKDYTPAMGLVSLAIMNGPEDLRDVMNSYKQIKEGFPKPKTFHSGYDNRYAQHPFSFFRGTIFNEYMNPNSKNCPNPKLAAILIQEDKTLWDTKFGNWVQKKLGIKTKNIETEIKSIDFTLANKNMVPAKKFITSSPIKDTIARAMTRTTKLGVIALGGIESTHAAHEIKNGENFFEQMGKSTVTLGTTIAATGIFGAIGAKYLGPTGSLVGMSLGAITGAVIGKAMD